MSLPVDPSVQLFFSQVANSSDYVHTRRYLTVNDLHLYAGTLKGANVCKLFKMYSNKHVQKEKGQMQLLRKGEARKWYYGRCASAVSCDGLCSSLRETREREKEEKSLTHFLPSLLSTLPFPLPYSSPSRLPLFPASSSPSLSFSPHIIPLLPDVCFSPILLFALSLYSKVKLMNDRACHQFPFLPLHMSHAHTLSYVRTQTLCIDCCSNSSIFVFSAKPLGV